MQIGESVGAPNEVEKLAIPRTKLLITSHVSSLGYCYQSQLVLSFYVQWLIGSQFSSLPWCTIKVKVLPFSVHKRMTT